jgi:hypothetical protein
MRRSIYFLALLVGIMVLAGSPGTCWGSPEDPDIPLPARGKKGRG